MFLPIRSLRVVFSLLAMGLLSATLGLAETPPDPETKGENPLLRARFRLQTLKSGKGEFNPEDLMKAKRHVKAMKSNPEAWPSSQPMAASSGTIQPLTAGIQPANWVSMGPGNAGGRIRSILVHPTNPDILYLGSVSGGIWKSLDRGASWTPLNDFMANLVISSMVMDPKNPSILYAGTGEYYSGGGFRGAGIFKSTDAGLTWNQLANTATPAFYYVNRLAISPLNSQVLLAATTSGLYRSIDGGATWSLRVEALIADVHFHPTDGTKAISGGYSAAWSSADAGVTWLPASIPAMTDSDRRWETAYAPSAPGTVYASVDNNSGELYVSFDGGRSYNVRNWGNSLLGQGWYDNTLWVDPADANKLLLGGTELRISSNAGQTFTIASYSIHSDHHTIVAAQGFPSPRTLYVGNDGGIYRIDDYFTALSAPQHFTNLNNGLAITQFYGAAGNLANGRVVGGTQDNGVRWSNGSNPNAWSEQYGGDGGMATSDPVLAADGTSFWYVEENGWNTWRLKVNSAGGFVEQFYLNNSPETHNVFIPPMILDPNSPTRLYKGGNSLWRLDNPRTQTVDVPWTRVKPAIPDQNNAISAIGVAVGNSNIIWVGHEGGPVYSTANALAATPTWVQRNTSGTTLPNWHYVSEIAIDPANSNRVYVGLAGFNPNNLWKSEDGGANWTDITANLPDVPVRAIAINKSNTNFIYAGTEVGLFASENRGGTWSPTNEGPANVSVDDLFWMGNKLVAATHGRGVFSIVINTPPTVALTAPADQATFTPGVNITLTATASDPDGPVARVEFYQGSIKLGEDATSPYAYTWNAVAAGSYALTARAIDLDQGSATSAVANITVGTPPGGTVRNPVADAHVRDGTSAGVNFGTSATLETKTNTTGYNRDAYLKFDMAGIAGFTSKATLRIFAKLSEAGTVNEAAHPVDNTAWTETGLTWNNRPALGAALSTRTLTGTTAAWYEFDVTAHVRKLRANSQATLGLGLHMVTAANPLIQGNSREAATGKPELVFTQTLPKALLVVGSLTLNTGDAALRNRLQAMGFTVTLKDGPSSTSADATGMSVVVISSTISSGSVNTKFRASATPVVNCEQALQDDFALTGTLSGTDFGNTATQTQLKILNAAHPLAGGVTGTLAVTTATDAFNWGKPNANAVKIAAIIGDDTRAAVYGYEKGASMVGLIAPARRVTLFPGDIAAGGFNASGWSLFDAAILWAAGF